MSHSDLDGSPPRPSVQSDKDEDTSSAPIDPTASPARRIHGYKWFLVVVATLSSNLIYALDNTIVADIIPAIVNDLHNVGQLAWLSVGFVVGGVSVVLPFGKLYGLFNAKWLYIISSVIFLAASALCGGAPSMTAEIVGRVLAGAGGNGMYLGCLTLMSVNTSDRERPTYLSLIGLVWGVGTVLGPVVGGAFEKVTWRWAFYINLIIGGVFAPVYFLLLPPFDPQQGIKMKRRFARIDFVGLLLIIGTLISAIMAINFGGVLYAWGSGQIIGLFVVAGVLTILFALQQTFTVLTSKSDRMFPVHFLRSREAVLLFVCAAAINAAGFIPIYYIPIYFQFTHGDTALNSAIRLLPLIFLLSFFILVNGHFMSKFGYYQPWYAFGSALAIVGGVLMSKIDHDTSTSAIYGYEVLVGIGTGCSIQAGYAVIQTVVDPSDMAYGIGFMMLAQLGGIALGLAVASAAFLNRALSNLQRVLPHTPRDVLVQAVSGTSGSFFQTLPPTIRQTALDVLIGDLRKVFIPVYVAAAVAFLGALFLKPRKAFIPVAAGG